MDLISVIVPVYNVEKYLIRCVNSILSQTYKNIEIILVDDGSPDNCPRICDELSKKYSNIMVVHKENGGLSSARNAGIEICKGKYISFVDSDDFIDKNFLLRLYDVITEYDADVAMLQYREVTSDDKLYKVKNKSAQCYIGDDVEKAFLDLKIDSVCVGLYLTSIIKNIRFEEGKTSEDIPFNFEVFKKIDKFVYLPEKRYYYYYNSASISNGVLDKNMLNYIFFREKIYLYYLEMGDKYLTESAESLLARAAFGLQTRMALYGISNELNEECCKNYFKEVFNKHKKAFYFSEKIPFSRKIISVFVFRFYEIIKILRK